MEIKAPEVLRVIIKWSEELERRIGRVMDGSVLYGTFSRKDGKDPEYLTKQMRGRCAEMTGVEQQERLGRAEEELKMRIRFVLGLLPDYIDKYEPHFRHIKPNSVRSGLLSYILS